TFTYDGHLTGAVERKEYEELVKSGRASADEPEVLDCGKYAGMTTMEARKAIVADLEAGGYIKNIEPLKHEVGICYRCHTDIEPMVSKQWFVRMAPLAEPAIESVEKGEVKFVPERFTKNYMNWMRGSRDWCISRQLWWGHRIPAWYCDDCGEMTVSKTDIDACPKCESKNIQQDSDTLDTWFSSALWPFSTLGWPDETEDYKHYYPTNTLVTGYDIIGFWVSRMIFSGLAYTGKAPFDTVLIHGLVRDSQGRKMSKSLGNGVDPLEIIDKFGADALRFMLATGNSPGNDMRYSDEKVSASRNFANKLWNASRFIMMNLGEENIPCEIPADLALEDKWVISLFNDLVKEVTDNLEKFELGIAVAKLYDFVWDIFCDWYIELAKIRLQSGNKDVKQVLVYIMTGILKLLHPFMPFITEEIYQTIPHGDEALMISAWPEYDGALTFAAEEAEMDRIMKAIRAIRNRRSEMNVPPSRKAKVIIVSTYKDTFAQAGVFMQRLASASDVELADEFSDDTAVCIVTEDAKIYIPMGDLIDFEAEKARLSKELDAAKKDLEFVNNKLNNENFVAKAPEAVVSAQREQAAKLSEKIAMLEDSIKKLG
ncbi:MAG: valine--tRNA ligase, partial [Clostridia bacterium]|nr:valine--tRNA ligase [Clostridia bacterium]